MSLLFHHLDLLLQSLWRFALPLLQEPGVGGSETSGGGAAPHWLEGSYEVDFVLVSLAVGAVGILLVVHLARRLTTKTDGPK